MANISKGFFFCLFIICPTLGKSQNWLQEAHRQQSMTRIGFGLQALEPTAVIFQIYKGGFCSNDDTYANYFTLETFAGIENTLAKSNKVYKTGTWSNGGFQYGLNALYPLLTLPTSRFSTQIHFGAGIQGGSRNYEESGKQNTANIFGGNLFMRFSFTGRGITIGDRLWFMSYFVDAKYHSEFGESFNYFRPSVGVVFRKVR